MNDFYNFFSFSAKRAVYDASELCQQFKNQYLEPEHILASVLKLRSCGAVQVMHQLEVNVPKFTDALETYLHEHAGNYSGNALFSQRTIGLLDLAYREVKRLKHREIGTAHLLIALAQDHTNFLENLFAQDELEARKIRETFVAHLKGRSVGRTKGRGPRAEGKAEALPGVSLPSAVLGSFDAEARETLQLVLQLVVLFGLMEVTPLFILLALALDTRGSANRLLVDAGCDVPKLLEELLRTLNAKRAETGIDATVEQAPRDTDDQRSRDVPPGPAAIPLGEMLPGHPGSLSARALEQLRGPDAPRIGETTAKLLGSAFAHAVLASSPISQECLLLGLLQHGGEEAESHLAGSGCDPSRLLDLASRPNL